jgi:DNA-directed RNA polymerase subunit RPC12/RpoP
MKVICTECKRSWRVDEHDAKKYGNRCPYCGNHYLKILRRYHEVPNLS